MAQRKGKTTKINAKKNEDPEEKGRRLYKTEICRNWDEQKKCMYRDKCRFAHGTEELRYVERHRLYKTVACQKFETLGECPYGYRCTFIHEPSPTSLQLSLDSIASSLPANGTASASSSPPSPSALCSPWATTPVYFPYQQQTEYVDDMISPSPSLQHQQKVIDPSVSALPRLFISSSSTSSSPSSSPSPSSSSAAPAISQQLPQGCLYLDFCHNGYQKYRQVRLPRFRLPGYCTVRDLLADGDSDGFHSAVGIAPPLFTLPTIN